MAVFEVGDTITINATPEKVRSILLDFDKYPEWSSFVQSVKIIKPAETTAASGAGAVQPAVGSTLDILVKAPSAKSPMNFQPTVTKNDESGFSWLGVLGYSFIFSGEHSFLINEISATQVEFVHSEKFNGVLAYLRTYLIGDTEAGFKDFNQALKARAELSE